LAYPIPPFSILKSQNHRVEKKATKLESLFGPLYILGYKNFCDFKKRLIPLLSDVKDYFATKHLPKIPKYR
jgi:hypothetical protein